MSFCRKCGYDTKYCVCVQKNELLKQGVDVKIPEEKRVYSKDNKTSTKKIFKLIR